MPLTLRLLLIIVPILCQIYIVVRIRNLKMKAADAFFWIVFSIALVILGLFPVVTISIANIIGVQSPANLVFLVMIALLLYKVFSLSTNISVLERKMQKLVQDNVVNKKLDEENDVPKGK